MKQYDPAGVLERVQSAPAADPQNLSGLMETLHLETRLFQQLTRKLPTHLAAYARELSRRANRHLACLKGMHILIAGAAPNVRILPVPGDPPDILLRQYYGRLLRLRTEYEARRSDPVYGPVFRALAADLPEQSRTVLELLGMLTK